MMDELKETLQTEDCALAVLHEGRISTFSGRGVRTLYNLLDEQPELLYGAKIADKAVGRTAARAMVEGGVSEVFAEVISDSACDTLRDGGVEVSYDRKVDHAAFLKIWQKRNEEI